MKKIILITILAITLLLVSGLVYSQATQNSDSNIKVKPKARQVIQSLGMGKPKISPIECNGNYCKAKIYLKGDSKIHNLGNIKIPLYYCSYQNNSIPNSKCEVYERYTKEELKQSRNIEIKKVIENFAKSYIERSKRNETTELEGGEITLQNE